MKIKLNNKVVLVTGSSGKIGGYFYNFLKEKCIVYGIDQVSKKGNKTFVGNIYDNNFVKNVINKIIIKHKKIDILINNAGKVFLPNQKKEL